MENFMDIFPSIQDMEDLWLIVVDTLKIEKKNNS